DGESPLDLRVKSFRGAAREAAESVGDETGASADADRQTPGPPADPDEAAAVGERVARAYEPPAPAEYEQCPGARAAVETLRDRGFALGLVTNGAEEPQRAKLRTTGLDGLFDATFFATPERGIKPDPRPFTTTADALGVAPEACVSVGDGYETDVEPAATLGMATVWVTADEGTATGPAPTATVEAVRRLPDLGLIAE
ncbi:MAG: HAD family hydrolase, partial [Halobaculum sp.]